MVVKMRLDIDDVSANNTHERQESHSLFKDGGINGKIDLGI